jgi:hypothetical protein
MVGCGNSARDAAGVGEDFQRFESTLNRLHTTSIGCVGGQEFGLS